MLILLVLGVVFLAIALGIWYFKKKYYQEFVFTEKTFEPSVYYYKDTKMHYHNLLPVYATLDDLFKEFQLTKSAKKLCIFFDSPVKVENPELCRSCIGFIADRKLTEDEEKQIKESGYKKAEFTSWKGVTTQMPSADRIAVVFGTMRAYPALFKYVGSNKHKYGPIANTPVIEIHGERSITYSFPIGEEKKMFLLTNFPKPKEKQVKSKTD